LQTKKEIQMKSILTALALAAAVLSACNKKESEKPPAAETPKVAEEPKADSVANDKPDYAVPDSFKVALGKVYAGYLQIEGALAHDDFAKAKSEFGSMHAVLHTLPVNGLDSTAKAQWTSLDERLMEVLHPMAASKDIGEMRNHLADFTPLMLEAIEKFGILGDKGVYHFHCPMARNNAGADWLQGDPEMENPFYGKSMSGCGSLVETIKK
jgi:Cu(I)/Ag(I) efflux system membrane fusion protein